MTRITECISFIPSVRFFLFLIRTVVDCYIFQFIVRFHLDSVFECLSHALPFCCLSCQIEHRVKKCGKSTDIQAELRTERGKWHMVLNVMSAKVTRIKNEAIQQFWNRKNPVIYICIYMCVQHGFDWVWLTATKVSCRCLRIFISSKFTWKPWRRRLNKRKQVNDVVWFWMAWYVVDTVHPFKCLALNFHPSFIGILVFFLRK